MTSKSNGPISWATATVLVSLVTISSSLSPASLSYQRTPRPSIARHNLIRVFNASNSPIRRSSPGFRPGKIFEDKRGLYWIAPSLASDRMVITYEEAGEQWTIYAEEQDKYLRALRFRSGALIPFQVSRIGESRDGQIWFADRSATARRIPTRPFFSSFDGEQWRVYRIDKDLADGMVNIGFFNDGANILWLWIGWELRGYDGRNWLSVKRVPDMLNEAAQPKPQGFEGRKDGAISRGRENLRYEILDAIQDRDGFWWLGTVGGIVRYQKERGEWKRFPEIKQNQHIYEDKLGRLWFADWDSVSVHDKVRNTTRTFRLSDHIKLEDCGDSFPSLSCVLQDKRGQMLFGHGCGLLCYSEITGQWERISLTDIGLENQVEDIIEDRRGRVWISTTSGVALLEP